MLIAMHPVRCVFFTWMIHKSQPRASLNCSKPWVIEPTKDENFILTLAETVSPRSIQLLKRFVTIWDRHRLLCDWRSSGSSMITRILQKL